MEDFLKTVEMWQESSIITSEQARLCSCDTQQWRDMQLLNTAVLAAEKQLRRNCLEDVIEKQIVIVILADQLFSSLF